ncbi:MAG TPA: energy transducer TonB [bacterium]
MRTRKLPDADLKLKYRKTFELSLASSLVITLMAFHALPNFDVASREIKAEAIQIKMEDIPPTEQIKQAPPPGRPSVPIPTENEDVPEDMTIETTELDLSEIPPPPPPPLEGSDYENYAFIPYDEPPTPMGGYDSIRKNLKYPEIARKAGIQGMVVVGVLIDEKGNSLKTQVLKESGMKVGFEEAAQAAVMSIKWKPARQRDKAVKVWVSIPVRFSLSEAKAGNT